MSAPGIDTPDRLDSWKEIAGYLGREVRTVQGWEKLEGLPVHRHQHGRQGTVFAFKSEIDAWQNSRRETPEPSPPPPAATHPARRPGLLIIAAAIVVLLGGAALVWAKVRSSPQGEIPTSVVVLPFLDLSPEKNQEYFSDGLTEELIDALTRVPNLRVVARTSAFAFKGKPTDIRRIGEQLNVAAVLEGSVRKSGDRLRITAQLARVSDGYHLWSRTYDQRLSDVFAVQHEIAESIANELRAGQPVRRDRPRDLEAWRLYLEGRYWFNQFQSPETERKAIARFEQAIARDPNFVQAHAGIADAYAYLAENFILPPKEVMPKAREAAEKALALDDSSSEAHVSLGIVKLDYDRDREAGQREFLRAIQLNPGSSYAHHWYAHSLEAQNRLDDAMAEMRRALELDPLSIPVNWDVAGELLTAKRYDESIAQLHKSMELFPKIPVFPFLLLQAYRAKGDAAAVRRLEADLRADRPEWKDQPLLLGVFAPGPREALQRLEELRRARHVDAFMALPLCAELKDRNQTLVWLKRMVEERSTMTVYLPYLGGVFGVDADLLAQAGAR